MPTLIVIGGPNGAGKSTAAPALLRDYAGVTEFVNADTVALGLSAFSPERVAVAAGRVVLQRVRGLIDSGGDFALESTLSGRTLASLIRLALTQGYRFHLIYLWIPSIEASLRRVQQRVLMGGHDVPLADLQRRYRRSVGNFLDLYRPLAHLWETYDNSRARPLLVARGLGHSETEIRRPATWSRILEVTGLGQSKDAR